MGARTVLIAISLIITLLAPCFASADAGIPMVALGLPFGILLLIPVVIIECYIFCKNTGMPISQIWKPIGLANLGSTLIGYPLAWLLQLVIEAAIILPASLMLSNDILLRDNWFLKVLGIMVGSAWLAPMDFDVWWAVPLAGAVGLIPAFYISVWLETKIVAWLLKRNQHPQIKEMKVLGDHSSLRQQVKNANVASYSFLLACIFMMFCINAYLTDFEKLHFKRLSISVDKRPEGTVVKLIRRGKFQEASIDEILKLPDVRSLEFEFWCGGHPNISRLAELEKIEHLNFTDCDLSEEELASFGRHADLKTLNLKATKITGRAFKDFVQMPLITTLDLSFSNFSDENVEYLRCFPNLEKLILSGTKLEGKTIATMSHLKNLKELNLDRTKIDDRSIEEISKLKSVERLSLEQTTLSGGNLGVLAMLPHLSSLSIGCICSDGDLKNRFFANSNDLNSAPGRFEISDSSVPGLLKIATLVELDVSMTRIDYKGIEQLIRLPKLKRLWVPRGLLSQDQENDLKKSRPNIQIGYRADR